MYLKHIPKGLQTKLSRAIWSVESSNGIYLTFDDGPSQHCHELLDLLAEHDAKASFFLLGENAEPAAQTLARLREEGHAVGNHGYLHLDGWKTPNKAYQVNMLKGKGIIGSSLFRPPYGRMTPTQWRTISKTEQIVMWDVMPGDFDSSVTADQCLERIINYARPGSVIVLHDNEQSIKTLMKILPPLLSYFKEKGFQLEPLSVEQS